jgi:hypothetical protein
LFDPLTLICELVVLELVVRVSLSVVLGDVRQWPKALGIEGRSDSGSKHAQAILV